MPRQAYGLFVVTDQMEADNVVHSPTHAQQTQHSPHHHSPRHHPYATALSPHNLHHPPAFHHPECPLKLQVPPGSCSCFQLHHPPSTMSPLSPLSIGHCVPQASPQAGPTRHLRPVLFAPPPPLPLVDSWNHTMDCPLREAIAAGCCSCFQRSCHMTDANTGALSPLGLPSSGFRLSPAMRSFSESSLSSLDQSPPSSPSHRRRAGMDTS
eukprot:TRINITY_DN94876_c0_g1_i1.p1 TRINITY_DN94876_c0_g1~~TRINITY_DN94876_c0_g1_i1.p1  ORF type:complete len:217 (-),score=6.59 TRINITY_DN94876_c0_g1_i1:199-828(-)